MLGRRRQHRPGSELLGVSCLLPDIPSSEVGQPLTSWPGPVAVCKAVSERPRLG